MIAPLHLSELAGSSVDLSLSLSLSLVKQKERKMFSDNVSSSFKIFNFRVMSKRSSSKKKKKIN